MNSITKNIGNYCRNYRINRLRLTLKEVEGNENIKTLSSFEHGRSTNINHIFKYLAKCPTKQDKLQFLEGFIQLLEGD